MAKPVLILDAGHGALDQQGNYKTFPTHGKRYTFQEHGNTTAFEGVLNREYANEIARLAQDAGFEVVKVYHEAEDRYNYERVRLANEAVARLKPEKALFYSQHFNAFGMEASGLSQDPRGYSIFTSVGETAADGCASEIVDSISPVLEKYGMPLRKDYTDGRNAAGKLNPDFDTNFEVLAYTAMPAVLCEGGFFTNWEDFQLLLRKDFREAFCKATFEGIVRWFGGMPNVCPCCKRSL